MKKIRLTESDLENIVKRVIAEQEEIDMEMEVEDEGEAIKVSLDHIAMLLKDGECSCSGQKLVLDLEGGEEEGEDDEEEEEDEIDY
jgi:hypothetical protein